MSKKASKTSVYETPQQADNTKDYSLFFYILLYELF